VEFAAATLSHARREGPRRRATAYVTLERDATGTWAWLATFALGPQLGAARIAASTGR